eukprot:TRINITY_DN2466_c0_g2_i1.p3 TRINITY_DN2466_c0_g2~~TRINITY_DN2466_c0_g2_i1.p3  ORF type:complete len:190 (+),score=0.64 TRINITY_DN2466_c0_g2_i1:252-821(+)
MRHNQTHKRNTVRTEQHLNKFSPSVYKQLCEIEKRGEILSPTYAFYKLQYQNIETIFGVCLQATLRNRKQQRFYHKRTYLTPFNIIFRRLSAYNFAKSEKQQIISQKYVFDKLQYANFTTNNFLDVCLHVTLRTRKKKHNEKKPTSEQFFGVCQSALNFAKLKKDKILSQTYVSDKLQYDLKTSNKLYV